MCKMESYQDNAAVRTDTAVVGPRLSFPLSKEVLSERSRAVGGAKVDVRKLLIFTGSPLLLQKEKSEVSSHPCGAR